MIPLGDSIAKTLNNLAARMAFQFTSYDAIAKLINSQENKLDNTPSSRWAIRNLPVIASGFGYHISSHLRYCKNT